MHGFSGATTVYDVAQDSDGRDLVALYVGDFDPSGLFMSEEDLPTRLDKYGGSHVELRRDCTDARTRTHPEDAKDFSMQAVARL